MSKSNHPCVSVAECGLFSWWKAYYAALAGSVTVSARTAHEHACEVADLAWEMYRKHNYGGGE